MFKLYPTPSNPTHGGGSWKHIFHMMKTFNAIPTKFFWEPTPPPQTPDPHGVVVGSMTTVQVRHCIQFLAKNIFLILIPHLPKEPHGNGCWKHNFTLEIRTFHAIPDKNNKLTSIP